MSDWTNQDILDAAAVGLRSQAYAKSMFGGSCAVLDSRGRRCAISHAAHTLRGYTGYPGERWLMPARCDLGRELGDNFIIDLQLAHDQSSGPADMVTRLQEVQRKYGLRPPPGGYGV